MKRSNGLFATLAIASLFSIGGSLAHAELVRLANGQTISGMIVSETETRVVISRHGQVLTLDASNVVEIDRADTTYYDEAYTRALDSGNPERIRTLFNTMRRHSEEAVRAKGAELEESHARLIQPHGEPGLLAAETDGLSTEELERRFRDAIDRIRWDQAVDYGRALQRRSVPTVSVLTRLLEAYRVTENRTAYLVTDAYRLYHYGEPEQIRASQLYLASALEERILQVWNEDKPDRTDAEVYLLLLARGMTLHIGDLQRADDERRKMASQVLTDLSTGIDHNYATRRIPGDFPMVIFARASRSRPEMASVFRYFALLKEDAILRSDTQDPILVDSLREARATYIYSISEIVPLPRERLWKSARDIALIGNEGDPPAMSDIMRQVFTYTPSSRHSELAFAYESLLIPEARQNNDRGESLRRAVELIAKRRCGAEFDREMTWSALAALATMRKGAATDGPVPLGVGDHFEAAFSVASEYERDRLVLVYEDRIVQAAREGEFNEGLLDATEMLARRRAGDSSSNESKWNSFRALAQVRRSQVGVGPNESQLGTAEVLDAAYSVAEGATRRRLALAFEERLTEAAFDTSQRGRSIAEALELIARHRSEDLSDPRATWNAYAALSAYHQEVGEEQTRAAAPTVSQIVETAFEIAPSHARGEVATMFSDRIHDAVLGDAEDSPELRRAVRLIALNRLTTGIDPAATWRAFDVHVRVLYGAAVTPDDILAAMEEMSAGDTNLRANALLTATTHYYDRASDTTFSAYRDRWVEGFSADINAWIASTARSGVEPPLTAPVPSIVLVQSEKMQEILARRDAHRDLLGRLDRTEAQFRQRFRPDRNIVGEDTIPAIVDSMNALWESTDSEAVHDRLIAMLDEIFDEDIRRQLLDGGLHLERPTAQPGNGVADRAR